MKALFPLLLALLIAACQSPVIHIYSRDLSQAQHAKIQALLEIEKVRYQFTNLQSPERYNQPSLLYHPQDSDQTLISAVERVVKGMGYEGLSIQVFSKDNHYYTQGNMGLYFPTKMREVVVPDLLFTHECADIDMQIQMKHTGQWVARNQTDLKGKWQYIEPYLTLLWFDGAGMVQQAYQGKTHTVTTKLGQRNAVTFSALGHRSYPLPILNCDLQAVFM
ncbi:MULTISPECIES: hypothetical protein [Pseudoalteromonas]|uniref:Uncharacterized protein n=1 Tax=Pseudoalteromonas amylolytica TaxID=1859457 RepID=A0A1S1MUI6_9GAMM|nr:MULTISPECIES: hypothetical protein [Pseudoalteromonas]OHU87762.1 hypothetical protein BFC16_10070 [Pseudoalteromonas sp. JW3]OHU91202.1 hypothetical protein BET10_10190 [Pseudoalteromonas amylolytica]